MKVGRVMDFWIGVPLLKLLSWFHGKQRPAPSVIKKILVIKLAAAGDTILLMPVLQAIQKAYPDASLDWLVSPINRELAELLPGVHRLFVMPRQTFMAFLQTAKILKAEKYDAVIDFEQWARGTALAAYLTGAPIRIGFDTPGQHRTALFTKTYTKRYDLHESQEFFNLAEKLGSLEKLDRPQLMETEKGAAELSLHAPFKDKINKKGPFVLMHPGCGSDGLPREWPIENYAVLAQWLMKKYGAKIFVTSGPEEMVKAERLIKLLHGEATNFGGRLTWNGLVSLASRMDLVISGNTGVMHIAAALGKKQVALHGPTNPKLWGPLNANSRVIQSSCPHCPCLRLGFEYHTLDQSCMKRIDVKDVETAVESLQPI